MSDKDPRLNLKRALVLGKQLQSVGSQFPLLVLIVDFGDCDLARQYAGRKLDDLNIEFIRVPTGIFVEEKLPKTGIDQWKWSYPKIYMWSMTRFSKLAYLDNDIVVLQNIDDLLDSPQEFGVHMSGNAGGCTAARFEDNFKFGGAANLLVLFPNVTIYNDLLGIMKEAAIQEKVTNEQAFINEYFKKHMTQHPPEDMLFSSCFMHFGCNIGKIRAVHLGFVGRAFVESMCNTPGQKSVQIENVMMRYVNVSHDEKIAAHVHGVDHLC
jgi:alpha-N-acetylglucosamine transferase